MILINQVYQEKQQKQIKVMTSAVLLSALERGYKWTVDTFDMSSDSFTSSLKTREKYIFLSAFWVPLGIEGF